MYEYGGTQFTGFSISARRCFLTELRRRQSVVSGRWDGRKRRAEFKMDGVVMRALKAARRLGVEGQVGAMSSSPASSLPRFPAVDETHWMMNECRRLLPKAQSPQKSCHSGAAQLASSSR
eukprot:717551_1